MNASAASAVSGAFELSLDNVTEPPAEERDPNPVIYTSGSRTVPYRNVLEITVGNDTGREIEHGVGRPAATVTLPDKTTGFVVGAISAERFELRSSEDPVKNSWALFPRRASTFGQADSFVVRLEDVTLPKALAAQFLVVNPEPGNRAVRALSMPLIFQDAPQPGDRDLDLVVTASTHPVYYAENDFAKRAESQHQQVTLHIARGRSKDKIDAGVTPDYNLRITTSFGDEAGDLLPARHAGFVRVETVEDYGNRWKRDDKRQEAPTSWEFTADQVFLRAGSKGCYDLCMKGVFPNDKEGYANLYVEYKNLKGYKGGVIVVPVRKKRPPDIEFSLATPGPYALDAEGNARVPVAWKVRNVPEWDGAVDIELKSVREGALKSAPPPGLLAAAPVAPMFPTSKLEGSAVFQIAEPRLLVLTAANPDGRFSRKTLTAEIKPPRIAAFTAKPAVAAFEDGRKDIMLNWTITDEAFLGRIQVDDTRLDRLARSHPVAGLAGPRKFRVVLFDKLERVAHEAEAEVIRFSDWLVRKGGFLVENSDLIGYPVFMSGFLRDELHFQEGHIGYYDYNLWAWKGARKRQTERHQAGRWDFTWEVRGAVVQLTSSHGAFGCVLADGGLRFETPPPLRRGSDYEIFPEDFKRLKLGLT